MNGLVVCGGQSSRMGNDKSMLDYHGIPQRYYIYNLLKSYCNNVYISCNKEQEKTIEAGYNYLVDEYENIGPMAALLRAFKEEETSWLVVGCDYPFIQNDDISLLLENKDSQKVATTYYNNELQIPEPLLGIYDKSCNALLNQEYEKENYSLKHFLIEYHAHYKIPKAAQTIQSVNTKEEYDKAIKLVGDSPQRINLAPNVR